MAQADQRVFCAVDSCELLGPFGDMWIREAQPDLPPSRFLVCGEHHKATADCTTTVRIGGALFLRYGEKREAAPVKLV